MEHRHEEAQNAEELMRTVEEIREAEERGAEALEAAKRKGEEKQKAAKERAVEISVKGAEEAVSLKNRLLAQGRKESEKEISKIIEKASSEAKKLKQEEIGASDAAGIARRMIGV